MTSQPILHVDGRVENPIRWTYEALAAIDAQYQIPDISQIDPRRKGAAVTLAGLLRQSVIGPAADYLTLHASADDFHASVPLAAVLDRAYVVYSIEGQPLSSQAGGPVRLLIQDSTACHAAEIDECANVKFLDRIELSCGKGHDNRPSTDEDHEALHEHS